MKAFILTPLACPYCSAAFIKNEDKTMTCMTPDCQMRGVKYEIPSFEIKEVKKNVA